MKSRYFMQKPEVNSELLTRGIVLGSHARQENAEYSLVELIDLVPWIINDVVENYNVVNMNTNEQTLLSQLGNWEMIFDADTLNPIKLKILYEAKKYLIDNLQQRVLNGLRGNILTSYQGILDRGLYRYKSENVYQYDFEEGIFFINLSSKRSVKYTYLRFFQNILLFLILRDNNLAFQYLDLSPDLHSKLELLTNFKVVDNGVEVEKTYFKLVDIYNYGLRIMFESAHALNGISYTYPNSRQILLDADILAKKLILNLAEET